MRTLRNLIDNPLIHVAILTAVMLFVLSQTSIKPMDDHFQYQAFIEALATGRIDFSISGFQGASFLAFPLYLVTRSPLASIHFQILCAALLIPMAYGAAYTLFKDRVSALFAAYAMAMMPFFFFLSFRGFTFTSHAFFILLTLFLIGKGSRFAWISLGISIIIKPFSAALIPFLLLSEFSSSEPQRALLDSDHGPSLEENKLRRVEKHKEKWRQAGLALLIPLLYVAAQFLQTGTINASSSGTFDYTNVFSFSRFPLNVAHGIQMLFSVHNFYFPDPALTRMSNMVHSSPLLMAFGICALLYPGFFFRDQRLARALGISFLAAYILAALLDHMDNAYMHTSVLLLLFASLPFLRHLPLLIPLVLATFHFQWLYAYLEMQDAFHLGYTFFTVPLVVDFLFGFWCLFSWEKVLVLWRGGRGELVSGYSA